VGVESGSAKLYLKPIKFTKRKAQFELSLFWGSNMNTETPASRKKNVVHIKGIKARVHIGTRHASVSVSIPINKLARALVKWHHVKAT
jgi:hypothetical protein